MREIILDANILMAHWRRSRKGKPLADCTTSDAEQWGRELVKIHQSDAIVTPVYLEFVGGVVHRHEMALAKAYLGTFRILDRGVITAEDWALARQLAERIPGLEPLPRGTVDCLIKAIARRFRCDVRTSDKGMPR